jgi:hypothetical protein
MLVFMPEKIFDLLFTLPRGGTCLNIHVHLLVILVAKVGPSLLRRAAIVRIPQPSSPVNPRLLPNAHFFSHISSSRTLIALDTTGSAPPMKNA